MGVTWTGPAAEDDGQGPTYVTKISVPCFGDDGRQRLHAPMKQEPPEANTPETEPVTDQHHYPEPVPIAEIIQAFRDHPESFITGAFPEPPEAA
jgi:hypothetical protein